MATDPSSARFASEDSLEKPVAVDPAREGTLGRYQLAYQIASGGMATVYLGRAKGPGDYQRPVAIKRAHPHLARKAEFVKMFLDEGRLASRIHHPNVCMVLDFGEADGTYYIAMEYLVGVPLQRLIVSVTGKPEALASSQWRALAARIVADACEGLHAAHELKDDAGAPLDVVHRDVSPQNLFVTFDGVVKVVDFGVAAARNKLHETRTGQLKGKLAYMAPEHAAAREIDRRADVWSLGVCLWEMLTGKRLFRKRNDMETLLAVREGAIAPPSSFVAGVPEALDRIVLRALERDPDARYPTARALGRELSDFVRRQDEAAGLAELSDWVTEMCKEDHTERLELVATTLGESSRVHDVETRLLPGQAAESSISVVVESRRHERSRSPILLVGGLVLVAALGVVAALVANVDDEESPSGAPVAGVATVASAHIPAMTERAPAPPPTDPVAEPSSAAVEDPIAEPATPAPSPVRSAVPRVRRAPRERPPAAVGEGEVAVVTVGGWADVYRGGTRLGRTPLRVTLPAGRHVLGLRPLGQPPERRVVVQVRNGELTRESVNL